MHCFPEAIRPLHYFAAKKEPLNHMTSASKVRGRVAARCPPPAPSHLLLHSRTHVIIDQVQQVGHQKPSVAQ